MKFSANALDTIATDLSSFTDPQIPELKLRDESTLENNILASLLGAFSGDGNDYIRYLVSNIVRRVFASMETYRIGRTRAYEYHDDKDRHNVRLYFLALSSFESCISYSWQIADLIRNISKKDLFEKGDGSAWERLHGIYTVGTKHSFERFDASHPPPNPTTIWLTNSGIACMNEAYISYGELCEIIEANNDLFYELQKRALEKRKMKKQHVTTGPLGA